VLKVDDSNYREVAERLRMAPRCGGVWHAHHGFNLGGVMHGEFLTEKEVADLLHTSVGTLRKRRYRRDGGVPPWFKAGHQVLFPRDKFMEWALTQAEENEVG